MNQQFEVKLLLKQNAQMISRIQVYRRENQMLNQKNQDLNLWVQNLSEVFAAIGGAWKSITSNEEALFNLMKKRSDGNSKSMISKYVSHFKAFDEIINRLGEKITNSGHSNEVTQQAKTRLTAFVNNYEMFFKQIVESYFKFNDEYLQWVSEIKNKPEVSANLRVIANKELENKLKIREFEGFMNEFRGRFKIYEAQNQHLLLDGLLYQQTAQINQLNELNQKLTRRLHLVHNYSTQNAQAILDAQDQDYECFCGGLQLQYFKKQWEKHLEQLRSQADRNKTPKSGEIQTNTSINKEQLELIEFEKQKLFDRVATLQTKIEKMKTQSRLSQDLVLNSSAYSILHSQTQELLIFIDELINKINNHYSYLYEIQKARQQEILELKNKLIKTQSTPLANKPTNENPKITIQTNLIEFKTNISQWIKDLKKQYTEINNKIAFKEDSLIKSKDLISSLQKQIDDLNKKIELIESSKNSPLEFRHQKFNQVEKKISQHLNNLTTNQENEHLNALWKQFITYVKSRDKKIRDLQAVIKKKEKDFAMKDKLLGALQQGLKETENVFLSAQTQVKKFAEFITNTEKELHSLAEKNLSLKSEFEQEKILMSYKAKADNEAKVKMEEKMKQYELLEEQLKQVRKITQETQLSYENWIVQHEKKLMDAYLQIQEARTQFELKKAQSEEKDRAIKKLIEEKEKLRSQCNKLGAKFNAIEQKSEMAVIKMEMEEYKRKIMCNCSRDQERSVVLKTCPHAFCKKCIEDMNNSRNRKCPLCGVKFGKSDLHDIILS